MPRRMGLRPVREPRVNSFAGISRDGFARLSRGAAVLTEIPVHPMAIYRLLMSLIILGVQVHARRVQRDMAKIVTDRPQVNAASA
jgi:hypothetical protein